MESKYSYETLQMPGINLNLCILQVLVDFILKGSALIFVVLAK